ncbi:hypothetical protein BGC33_00795, partial [Bathymodiolus thermophilus thioautotrophic gill symbiont]
MKNLTTALTSLILTILLATTAMADPVSDCDKSAECVNLGLKYEIGKGVKQDYLKAAAFYRKGCGLNDSLGCANLGLLYLKG